MKMLLQPGKHFVVAGIIAFGALTFGARNALAVPSFSRQTGLPCEDCHTVAPQLTAFGRYFKMNGYVLSSKTLSPSSSGKTPKESIGEFPPISAMVLVSDTLLHKAQPGSQNGSVAFPDQLSLFYAGRIASHLGTFLQITYDGQSDHFSLDNTDIRYAQNTSLGSTPLLWGLTLNNNPTVGDPWNSTPAWGWPYLGSPSAPGPAAAPLVESLGGEVAGIGGYGWFNNSIYGAFSVYRSSQIGGSQPLDTFSEDVISGVAPYARLAWEHNWSSGNYTNSFEVGTFALLAHLFPNGVSGPTDNYRDLALDSQYTLLFPNHSSLAIHGLYINEKQTLDASFQNGGASKPSNHLNTWSVNAQYYWSERFGPSIGYFSTTGSTDPLLYPDSRTGSPDSSGWILQWTYLPAQNVQIGAQYTIYNKFDGSHDNYDGTGRSASDNNALYIFAWFLW